MKSTKEVTNDIVKEKMRTIKGERKNPFLVNKGQARDKRRQPKKNCGTLDKH